jgi:hypothetical protein
MQPIDPTTSNALPPDLHFIGDACSLRHPHRPLQHRVELLCLKSMERVRVYGKATTRDHSMLVQFNSCMKPDGQLERHTVFFSLFGKHRVVVHGNGIIEVVQIFQGRIHAESRRTDHVPITESSLLFYIVANWHSLLRGQRLLVSLIRLPHLRLQTCELVRGDAYSNNGENRIDILLRGQKETKQGTLVATGLPAVLTFDVQTKHPVSFEGVATYVGGNSMAIQLQFTRT